MTTPNIPIQTRMFAGPGGFLYKHRAIGLVNKKAAERAGLTLDDIISPYTLWNSTIPNNSYVVFGADSDRELRELEKNQKFKNLTSNPRYEKLFLYYNN